ALFIAREVPRQVEVVIGLHEHKELPSQHPDEHPANTHRLQALLNLRPHGRVVFDLAAPDLGVVLQVDALSILFHRNALRPLKNQHAAIDWVSLPGDELPPHPSINKAPAPPDRWLEYAIDRPGRSVRRLPDSESRRHRPFSSATAACE